MMHWSTFIHSQFHQPSAAEKGLLYSVLYKTSASPLESFLQVELFEQLKMLKTLLIKKLSNTRNV